jgi:epoxide hydrolase-like predicted phosphatase
MIRAVIFDLGGVLVRTEDPRPRAAAAARYGLTWEAADALVFRSESAQQATLGQITTAEHQKRTMQTLGAPESQAASFFDQFFAGDRLDRELVDFIRSLRPRYKTALLSNAWDNLRSFLEETWRIADAFDHITISAEVGCAKPDPQIYRLTLEALDVRPEEAIFVDDFPENIAAAQALGIHGVHFRSPEQCKQEILNLLG